MAATHSLLPSRRTRRGGPLRPPLRSWLWLSLLLLGLCAPAGSQQQAPSTAQSAAAARWIALAPHLVELVYAAGAGQRLVAVGAFSDEPPAARQLPKVADAFSADYERILALKPDLVLVWPGGTPQRQIERLQSLGLPLWPLAIERLDDVADALLAIGERAGSLETARAAAASYKQRISALRNTFASRTNIAVFVQIWDRPLTTYGGRHAYNELLAACGARNVFADVEAPTATVGREAALARRPELVLSSAVSARLRQAQQRPAAEPTLRAWVDALGPGQPQLALVDADLTTRLGPRLPEGLAELCAAIDRVRMEKRR